MADEPVSFVLDLDNSSFMAAGEGALGIIEAIGSPSNLVGLVESLGGAAEALGAVGLAAEGFKVALDMTIEGEHIQQIEKQFEQLSEQAGLSGEALKNALVAAAGGLVSTNELLVSANKGLVELGPSASHLPEVMTLARQSVSLFGGEVKATFDQMLQALANGNTRWLKHHGIIIDTSAALQKFADDNGVAVNSLSQSGKQQALFNAGLEAAQKRFAGVSTSIGQTTTAVGALKSAWAEFVELIDVAFAKTLGPHFASFFDKLRGSIHTATTWLKAEFGGGAEKAAASTELLTSKVDDLKKHIDELQKGKGRGAGIDAATAKIEIEQLQITLKKYEAELAGMQKQKAQTQAEDDKNTNKQVANQDKVTQNEITNKEKLKQNNAKYLQEKLKLENATDKELEQQIQSTDQIDAAIKKQELARAKEHSAALKKIQADQSLDAKQKRALVNQEDKRFDAQELNAAKNNEKVREKLNKQYLANSKNMYTAIGRAAKVQADKARAEQADYGKQGDQVYGELTNTATTGFAAIGTAVAANKSVAESTADAMKAAALGAIGKEAEERGTLLLLSSIWPPNPLGIAAGGALIAFGAAVSSMAGSSSGASVSGGGGGGTGGGAGSAGSSGAISPTQASATQTQQSQQLQQQQQVQRTVSINIAGHYLNSQESQRTLMEIMRNETDATGFQYNKIGV